MTAVTLPRSPNTAIAVPRIFTEVSPKTKEGDFFRIPFLSIVQVVRRFCVGDEVWLIVANGRGDRERWIVPLNGDRGSGRVKKAA